MPELPEVEVVRKSLHKKIKQKKIKKVIVRNRNLRLKVPLNFSNYLEGKKIIEVRRFSKYIIFFYRTKVIAYSTLECQALFMLFIKRKKIH